MSKMNSAVLLALSALLSADVYASNSIDGDDEQISRPASPSDNSSDLESEFVVVEPVEQQVRQHDLTKPFEFPGFEDWKKLKNISDIKTAEGQKWLKTLMGFPTYMSEASAKSWIVSYGNYKGYGAEERANDLKIYEDERNNDHMAYLYEQGAWMSNDEMVLIPRADNPKLYMIECLKRSLFLKGALENGRASKAQNVDNNNNSSRENAE